MFRGSATALAAFALTLLSACGNDSGTDSSDEDGSGAAENSQASTELTTEPPTEDPAAKAVESLASILEGNSTGAFGFTHGQAECVAEGFVEQFGIEGLQEIGYLTTELEPASPSGSMSFSPVDASATADATLACVDGGDFLANMMNARAGGFDEATVECIADNLGDDGMHDLLVAAFRGDQQALQDALAPAAFSCAM